MRVIEQMTLDLNLPVRIVRCPTLREKDGLAMSSRNAYLSALERAQAPRLHLALQHGEKTPNIPPVHEPAGGLPQRRFHPRSTYSLPN